MSLLFGRIAKVTAYRARAGTPGGFIASNPAFFDHLPNGIEITKLRIKANVDKHIDKEPNTCKITIANCNDQTRTFLSQKPLTVLIEAGYDNAVRYLFKGDARTVYTDFSDATAWTTLELADGDRAFRYGQVNRAYRKGTTRITAIKDCAAALGLRVDPKTLASPELQSQFAAGRTLSRDAQTELSDLLAQFGFRWSIQHGTLQILKDNETRPDEAVVISEDTGMIGSPTFTTPDKPGKPTLLKVKTKLYPQLTAGSSILVRSRGVHDGVFRIEKVVHELDTRDGPWDSTIEAKACS